jgi:hypothetical protein
VKSRLVAAYLVETITPAEEYGPTARLPACQGRGETGCVAAWASLQEGDFQRLQELTRRSLIWDDGDQLIDLDGRQALCFNPLLGGISPERAPARLNLGAANATGLEWGARPAFLQRQVWAQCENGLLHTSRPKSKALRDAGSWADRRKVDGFNLFYADIEADAQGRVATMLGQGPQASSKASSPQ